MLHVLLTILKILGILILAILGIILTVILLVLLVPIRYRTDVSFDGKPKGSASVSWLLHLIHVQVCYDEKLSALVKILGFRLFDKILWPSNSEEAVEDTKDSIDEFMEDEFVFQEEEPKAKPVKEDSVPEAKKMDLENRASKKAAPKNSYDVQKKDIHKKVDRPNKDGVHQSVDESVEEDVPKEPFFDKIKKQFEHFINKITELIRKIAEKKQMISKKYDQAMEILKNPENQKTFRLILRQIGRLIRHILPRKLTGRIRFGFDDPYTTGQILTYISPFYGIYAKTFSIEPVFDEKVIEGEVHLKGKIRLGGLLWIVIRIFLDKNFRRLLKGLLAKKK